MNGCPCSQYFLTYTLALTDIPIYLIHCICSDCLIRSGKNCQEKNRPINLRNESMKCLRNFIFEILIFKIGNSPPSHHKIQDIFLKNFFFCFFVKILKFRSKSSMFHQKWVINGLSMFMYWSRLISPPKSDSGCDKWSYHPYSSFHEYHRCYKFCQSLSGWMVDQLRRKHPW